MTTLADRLLPDQLWQRLQPLLPPAPSRARGGAPRTVPDRACMAAIVFMARTSTPWALLPVGEFGCGSVTTCWRRFAEWAHAGVFERLQEVLLDELGEAGGMESSQRLGRHRWKAERTIAWLAGCRRLRVRYDRDSERFFAFVLLACDRLCYNRLPY